MYLKKLEINGFKSFAKKTRLDFQPGITSIVGPNGSGKSNIADSLRWVFGEQSMKLLRGKKSEDVIFAGSEGKARLGAAEVLIYFDNSDNSIPIDYSEVVIGRRLYRNGNSEYLINNNVVRMLDIQELLNKAGFGNTSYHVIGQGKIDQMISSGPTAVKDLIEEASQVKPYYQKRDRTVRRLERTSQNLSQVQALVSELAPRVRSLRRQARRIQQREEIVKQLRELQANYFASNLAVQNKQLSDVNEKLKIFERQASDIENELGTLTKSLEQKESGDKKHGSKFRQLRDELGKLHNQKHKVQEQIIVLRGELKVKEIQAASGESSLDLSKFKDLLSDLKRRWKTFIDFLKAPEQKSELWQREAERIDELLVTIAREVDSDEEKNNEEVAKKTLEKISQLELEFETLDKKIIEQEKSISTFAEQEEQEKNQFFVQERLLRSKQDMLMKTKEQKSELQIEQAKITTRTEALEREAREELGANYKDLIAEVKPSAPNHTVTEKIKKLKHQLGSIGGVDELIIQEYKETEERYQYLVSQSEDLEKAAKDLMNAITELDEVIKKQFGDAFAKISEKFSEYFRTLFGGGRATMQLIKNTSKENEETEDQPSQNQNKNEIAGIELRATPPGKKLAGVASLSGGERALTAIALLSAILATYPSPFVVLDEVDAALDEANSIRFGKILGTLADKTQFITITHNRETMRQSHTLYGVTMGDDSVSRVLSLKLEEAAVYSSKN